MSALPGGGLGIRESSLDTVELRILDLSLDRSLLVTGSAGAGKSVLALRKALRIEDRFGPGSCLVIVYTQALRDCMEEALRGEFHSFAVQTFSQWERDGYEPYDYLVVDEAQDFKAGEVRAIFCSAHRQVFFFGDSAQSIYEDYAKGQGVDLMHVGDHDPKMREGYWQELMHNYRLPVRVARLAQRVGRRLGGFSDSLCRNRSDAMPVVLGPCDLEEQLATVARVIHDRDLRDVGILILSNDLVAEAVSCLRGRYGLALECKYKAGKRIVENSLRFGSPLPKIMTVHQSQGLEFANVFVIEAQSIGDPNLLYVACTRTYGGLFIMHGSRGRHRDCALGAIMGPDCEGLYATSLVTDDPGIEI